jgi:hypothetical protein
MGLSAVAGCQQSESGGVILGEGTALILYHELLRAPGPFLRGSHSG